MQNSITKAPVLLITFNRPDYTIQVFEKIRQAKVKRLYIANDGPREGNIEDQKAREEIKNIIDSIDWDCEVHILFQEKNLGCGWGPASAITWAFEKEDRLIILEDDCVPTLPFFEYCSHCLEKYKNDTRVWLISGRSHHQGSKFFNDSDYIFSHYGHTWGWATWKRCWNHFDMRMEDLPKFLKIGGAVNVLATEEQGKLYNKMYEKLFHDRGNLQTHAWDYQFGYAILKNGGLSIVPSKNLIHNIGAVGTHSKSETSVHKMGASEDYKIKREPKFVIAEREYEILHFNTHMIKIFGFMPMYKRFFRKIKKLWKRLWKK
jgi:hypothetical protein